MKRSLPLVLVLAGAVTMTACSRDTDKQPIASETPSGASTSPPAAAANERDKAMVRVVDAVPGPPIDVTAEQEPVATQVTFPSVTPYKEVPASADDFAVKIEGRTDGPVLADNSESIMGGRHYTLVAFPGKEDDKVAVKVISDDMAMPAEGKARVRVINAASGAEEIDLVAKISKDVVLDDVSFREASSYKEVDPSIGALEVRSADGKKMLAQPSLTLDAGKSYTIVAAGKISGTPAFQAVVIEDRVEAPAATD
jgi:hypothetical protein